MKIRRLLTVSLFALSSLALTEDNPAARFQVLSDADCSGPGHIIADTQAVPRNVTYLRAQFIGDPGSDERRDEVANEVSWDVGAYSGFHAPAAAQRGYRDGPPGHRSAFQLDCTAAGFFIDTASFPHSMPILGAGPGASIARSLDPAAQPFQGRSSTLILEARIAVPWAFTPVAPIVEGTAQVSFVYYARDITTGARFAHVIALFDNRTAAVVNPRESVQNDGQVAFVSSPLLETRPDGTPTRFVRVSPLSPQMRFVQPWAGPVLFRAQIPYDTFRDMLLRIKADALPAISSEPSDYRIYLFGVLGEVFPGIATAHEVSLGASVSEMRLLRDPGRKRVGSATVPLR